MIDDEASLRELAMSKANERQVGGGHYATPIQHWDYVVANDLDYFQGQITKYVTRWKRKNGVQDLEKAKHFLEKYLEIARATREADKVAEQGLRTSVRTSPSTCHPARYTAQVGAEATGRGYVNQDR
jgi:hypothetical protein